MPLLPIIPDQLDDLDDVDLSTPPGDGQVLKYDTGTSMWLAGDDDTGSGLPTASTKGDIAVYDGDSWEILAAGTNSHVLTADSAETLGLKWAAGGGGAGALVSYDTARRTAGNITLNATTFTAIPTAGDFDLVLAASAGDFIICGMSGFLDIAASLEYTNFDMASMVSGSPVNWVSGGATLGVAAWFVDSDEPQFAALGGTTPYVVQAGDLSGGNITLRPFYVQNVAGNRTLRASTDLNFTVFAYNLGQ